VQEVPNVERKVHDKVKDGTTSKA